MKHRFAQVLACSVVVLACGSALAQSSRPGMGATPYADSGGGTTFRLWSPNSTSVSVAGEFNGWNSSANPLTEEGTSGFWSADVPGASHGQEYKYVLNGSTWKKDPRGRKVTYTGLGPGANSIVYDPGAFDWGGINPPEPWQNDLVIYEMHIGAFYDPTPFDNFPGTFYDATNLLNYIDGMGINAVELMPIVEFPGDRSWGYNPAEIFAVENVGYGGPDGLKTFVKAANSRGIAVFLDTVHNHYETYDQDLWDFDTNWGPGIYFFPNDDGKCCTLWGQRPNYTLDPVRSFIIDNFTMWVDEYHIGGFRWDSVGSMREYDTGSGYAPVPWGDALIAEINNNQLHGNPARDHVISIAEDRPGSLGFDGEWDHAFKDTLVDVVTQPLDSSRDMVALQNAISGSGHFPVLFSESHDTTGDLNGGSRVPVKIDGGNPSSYFARKRSTLAAAVVLTAPGKPMLFMGQEMLEDNVFADDDPLDWNGTNTHAGINRLYRDLIHLRRNLDGVSLGLTGPSLTWDMVDNTGKVLAYHRHGAGFEDQVLVVLNFSSTTFSSYWIHTFPADGPWYVNLNSDWTEYGSDFGNYGSKLINAAGGSGELQLAPYSFLILTRQPLADIDHDSDGMTSGDEIKADTRPWDASSLLRVHDVQNDPGGIEVRWHGGVAATQILRRATNPVSPVWEAIHTNPPPTAISNNWTDLAPAPDAFIYRIEAVPGS